jgi:hypothetical protein
MIHYVQPVRQQLQSFATPFARGPVSRRQLLVAAAGAAVIASCGGADSTTTSPAEDNGSSTPPTGGLAVVRFFAEPSVLVGPSRRLVFGLADSNGTLREQGPTEISAAVLDAADAEIATAVGRRRDSGLPRAYYEMRVDVPTAGPYTLRVELDGESADMSFSASPAEAILFPSAGSKMPGFDTPTLMDPRGVDPVCTQTPMCSFHNQSLNQALAAGTRIAYLVGTPAFCQTAICGPILEVMTDVAADYPTISFLHTEVYTDNTATTVAPGVEALKLSFEQVIFLIDTSGTIIERLDVIVDESELREQLDALQALA